MQYAITYRGAFLALTVDPESYFRRVLSVPMDYALMIGYQVVLQGGVLTPVPSMPLRGQS